MDLVVQRDRGFKNRLAASAILGNANDVRALHAQLRRVERDGRGGGYLRIIPGVHRCRGRARDSFICCRKYLILSFSFSFFLPTRCAFHFT